MKIRPCTECEGRMEICQTSARSVDSIESTFYFVACHDCGFGPYKAYRKTEEAVAHWNCMSKLQLEEEVFA